MFLIQYTLCALADNSVCLRENVIEAGALCHSLFELHRLATKLLIGELSHLFPIALNLFYNRFNPF